MDVQVYLSFVADKETPRTRIGIGKGRPRLTGVRVRDSLREASFSILSGFWGESPCILSLLWGSRKKKPEIEAEE